jgi:hypothetical protein
MRYFNYNGKCVRVSDLCRYWDESTGACTECYDGYSVSAGLCIPKQAQAPAVPKIVNCAEFSANGDCVKCSRRFYYSNNECLPVNDNCKTWN